MAIFTEINANEAWNLVNEQNAHIIDTRDAQAFALQHPQNAFHLTDASYPDFLQQYDEEQPLIITCYHGINSRQVANFLAEQGFEQVYSLKGGFESWLKANLPTEKSQ